MGYLLEGVSLDTLINGLETIYVGKPLGQPAPTETLIQSLQGFKSKFQAPDIIEALSPEELEVLGLMALYCFKVSINFNSRRTLPKMNDGRFTFCAIC